MRYVAALILVFFCAVATYGDGLDLPIEYPKTTAQPQPHSGGKSDPRDGPPPTIYGEEIDTDGDTIVYVIDISCSMTEDYLPFIGLSGGREEGARIDRAKAELVRSISGLPKNMRFSVLAYSCYMKIWNKVLQEANPANKRAAMAWVLGLTPTDSTGTGPAVSQALALDRKNLSVVLLTDGAPNCGTAREMPHEHRKMILDANTQHAKIDVFGIADKYPQHRDFCKQVASDSGGNYHSVP